MSEVEKFSTIPEIRKQVDESLSSYFDEMSSGEFEGVAVYPENSKIMVAVFLAASANHSMEEIEAGFQDVLNKDEIADAYASAFNFIGSDPYLTMGVMGVARKLDIPQENISIA